MTSDTAAPERTADISPKERKFIRHALGLEYERIGYRNRYLAAGDAVSVGKALVAKGMAIEGDTDARGSIWFIITENGFKAASKSGERMDREEAAHMAKISRAASDTLNAREAKND